MLSLKYNVLKILDKLDQILKLLKEIKKVLGKRITTYPEPSEKLKRVELETDWEKG